MTVAPRTLFIFGFGLCAVLMGTALYMEHVLGLEPCPLCALQRLCVIGLGLVMLAGAIHDPRGGGRRIYGVLITLVAGCGVVVAGRHVWLQNLPPDRVPDCGPGLEYMFGAFPWTEALQMVFSGSGECAEVQWQFLGLTIPGWTLLVFIGLVAFGLYLTVFRSPQARGEQTSVPDTL